MYSDSFYLDYNATSPFVRPVIDYLSKGDFLFANPASSHSLGKKSRRLINECKEYILSSFHLSSTHKVIYHSGATEWINTIFNLDLDDLFIYFSSDHAAVTSVAKKLKKNGIKTLELKIDSNGLFDKDAIASFINSIQVKGKKWLNYTFVHNETGVVWDLELASFLKNKCNLLIHVDAVQSISKTQGFELLQEDLDCYTFSSHKFGGPKSFGFSLIKSDILINPLIVGGSQQYDFRAGTENPLSAKLTDLALRYHLNKNSVQNAVAFREELEEIFEKSDYFKVVAKKTKRAVNTVGLICSRDRSDVMLANFDMNGIYISSGSACSSGSVLPSRTITDMGLSANNFLRLSFSPLLDFDQSLLKDRLTNIISNL